MALLEIANLTVEFPTMTGPFKAVDGVDLSVDQGDVVAIVGESGSGKSVAMLAVMGLLALDRARHRRSPGLRRDQLAGPLARPSAAGSSARTWR